MKRVNISIRINGKERKVYANSPHIYRDTLADEASRAVWKAVMYYPEGYSKRGAK